MDRMRRALLAGGAAGLAASVVDARAASSDEAGAGGVGLEVVELPPGPAVVAEATAEMPDFRYGLDASRPTIASGGWAKEVNERRFPFGKGMAGVHMFLDPGASREPHWHSLANEWAFVIAGRCQTVVLAPDGASEINNFGPGDLWYFPRGHGHSIQCIGDKPCHFILSFDDGRNSPEVGTFSLTDWIDVTPKDLLAADFGIPAEAFDSFPKGQVYIQAGSVLPPADALEAPWPRESTHKFSLMHDPRAVRAFAGGSFRLATVAEWPISKDMAGGLLIIRPGEQLQSHWHPNSNEWNYVLEGRARVALFGSNGRARVADLGPGDVGYYPRGFGHAIRNVGSTDLRIVQTWDAGRFEEITLAGWVAAAPRPLLANNFAGVPGSTIEAMKAGRG